MAEEVKEVKNIHAVFENYRKKETNMPPKVLIGDSGIPEPDEESFPTNFQTNTSVQKVTEEGGNTTLEITEDKGSTSNPSEPESIQKKDEHPKDSEVDLKEGLEAQKLEEVIIDKSEVINEGLRKGVVISDPNATQEDRQEDFGDIKSTDSQMVDSGCLKPLVDCNRPDDQQRLIEGLQKQVDELKQALEASQQEVKRLKDRYEPREIKESQELKMTGEVPVEVTQEEAPKQDILKSEIEKPE